MVSTCVWEAARTPPARMPDTTEPDTTAPPPDPPPGEAPSIDDPICKTPTSRPAGSSVKWAAQLSYAAQNGVLVSRGKDEALSSKNGSPTYVLDINNGAAAMSGGEPLEIAARLSYQSGLLAQRSFASRLDVVQATVLEGGAMSPQAAVVYLTALAVRAANHPGARYVGTKLTEKLTDAQKALRLDYLNLVDEIRLGVRALEPSTRSNVLSELSNEAARLGPELSRWQMQMNRTLEEMSELVAARPDGWRAAWDKLKVLADFLSQKMNPLDTAQKALLEIYRYLETQMTASVEPLESTTSDQFASLGGLPCDAIKGVDVLGSSGPSGESLVGGRSANAAGSGGGETSRGLRGVATGGTSTEKESGVEPELPPNTVRVAIVVGSDAVVRNALEKLPVSDLPATGADASCPPIDVVVEPGGEATVDLLSRCRLSDAVTSKKDLFWLVARGHNHLISARERGFADYEDGDLKAVEFGLPELFTPRLASMLPEGGWDRYYDPSPFGQAEVSSDGKFTYRADGDVGGLKETLIGMIEDPVAGKPRPFQIRVTSKAAPTCTPTKLSAEGVTVKPAAPSSGAPAGAKAYSVQIERGRPLSITPTRLCYDDDENLTSVDLADLSKGADVEEAEDARRFEWDPGYLGDGGSVQVTAKDSEGHTSVYELQLSVVEAKPFCNGATDGDAVTITKTVTANADGTVPKARFPVNCTLRGGLLPKSKLKFAIIPPTGGEYPDAWKDSMGKFTAVTAYQEPSEDDPVTYTYADFQAADGFTGSVLAWLRVTNGDVTSTVPVKITVKEPAGKR